MIHFVTSATKRNPCGTVRISVGSAVIPDRLRRVDMAGQGRFGDDAPCQTSCSRSSLLTTARGRDQAGEEVEDLRPIAIVSDAASIPALGDKHEVCEQQLQIDTPRPP